MTFFQLSAKNLKIIILNEMKHFDSNWEEMFELSWEFGAFVAVLCLVTGTL